MSRFARLPLQAVTIIHRGDESGKDSDEEVALNVGENRRHRDCEAGCPEVAEWRDLPVLSARPSSLWR
jgi:hypothetical protein